MKLLFETKPKKFEFTYSSKKIKEIVDFWEGLGLKKINTEKIAEEANKKIRKVLVGTLFNNSVFSEHENKKFDAAQIGASIIRFSQALDPFHLPIDKTELKKKTLPQFFYNPYAKTYTMKSLFLLYLIKPPIEVVENTSPKFTQTLINLYEDNIISGKTTEEDIQIFRRVGRKAFEFLKENFNKMSGTSRYVGEEVFANWVFQSVFLSTKPEDRWKIHPSWFTSNITFSSKLPAYLKSQGILDVKEYRGR